MLAFRGLGRCIFWIYFIQAVGAVPTPWGPTLYGPLRPQEPSEPPQRAASLRGLPMCMVLVVPEVILVLGVVLVFLEMVLGDTRGP